jgi:hypothetical protein
VKLRQGRKNPRNLYYQWHDEPSNDDVCLGLIIDPDVAAFLASEVNADIDAVHRLESVICMREMSGGQR